MVALLDSSAFAGYLVRSDALHADAVAAIEGLLRGGTTLAISVVVWTEMLNGAHQEHHEEDEVRGFVRDFGVAIVPVDVEVAEAAASLQAAYIRTGRGRDRPRLRTADALILATAVVYEEINTVVGGDAKWMNVPSVDVEIVLLRESS